MTNDTTPAQESAGTIEEPDKNISGPHMAEDRYGWKYTFYRCEACGAEATRRSTLAQGGCDCADA